MKRRNKMGMMKEFRDFAVRGNVVDMAVGVDLGFVENAHRRLRVCLIWRRARAGFP